MTRFFPQYTIKTLHVKDQDASKFFQINDPFKYILF